MAVRGARCANILARRHICAPSQRRKRKMPKMLIDPYKEGVVVVCRCENYVCFVREAKRGSEGGAMGAGGGRMDYLEQEAHLQSLDLQSQVEPEQEPGGLLVGCGLVWCGVVWYVCLDGEGKRMLGVVRR